MNQGDSELWQKSALLRRRSVPILAIVSAVAVALANLSGISIGDDGVGYQAIADSILRGDGLGYFLEDPVTVWPPVWPSLMALVAWLTPFGTVGAAIILNSAVAAAVVIAANHLMRLVIHDDRLILAGTAVVAIGPATIGLGHVLMTDMAFALVSISWMAVLIRAHDQSISPGSRTRLHLVGAGLAWLGFGLRYVGVVLIAFGGLWLLLEHGRDWASRLGNSIRYGVVASLFPLAWMARNYAIDETFTGERHTSARGLIDNGYDLAATIGRFILPGVGNGALRVWAAVGVVATVCAVILLWAVVHYSTRADESLGGRCLRLLGSPIGLIGSFAVLYLSYMLYVRTTTALNQLEIRLLFPAYFPLIVTMLAMAERLTSRQVLGSRSRLVVPGVMVWASMNVVVGVVGVVLFGGGRPFFAGDYAGPTFERVRDNPALDAVPEDCEVWSNLPNALYPLFPTERWSPQERALESIDPVPDLQEVIARSDTEKLCLVWIDEKPVYGHLWSIEELRQRLHLKPIASDGPVSVYLMSPPTSR